MDPKVAKLANLAQIWTSGPLIRLIIRQRVILEGPESPKSLHKLVLPESVSKSAFYMVILGKIANQAGQNTGLGSQNGNFGTLNGLHTTETCLVSVTILFKCQCDCFPDTWSGNRDSALFLVASI